MNITLKGTHMLRVFWPMFLFLAMAFPANSTEEAPFQLLRKVGEVEVRKYPPLVVVETTVTGDMTEAGDAAFRPLFRFISGANQRKEEIAMTSPVILEGEKIAMTAPVVQERKGGAWVVQFVLPAKYTMANAPTPTDPNVRLRETPARTVAAIRYSGRWTQSNYDEALAALRQGMAAAGLTATGDPIWMRYDAPFTPGFLRRNEILIPISGE
jgi:effector-binding domain-containing protein